MKIGFYDYDKAVVGEDGVIFKDTFKGGSTPTGCTDVGSPTWGSDGMVSAVDAGVKFEDLMTDAANAHLDVEGTLRFMVTIDAISAEPEDVPAATANIVGIGNSALVINHNGSASPSRGTHGYCKPFRGANLIGRLTRERLYYFGSPHGWDTVGGKVEVIITWDGGGVDLYVDKFKAWSVPWTVAIPSFTSAGTPAYLGSTGSGGSAHTFSDVLMTTKKVVLPVSLSARNVHIYGDSYAKQGQYQPHDANDYQASAFDSVTNNGAIDVDTIDGLSATTYSGIYNGVIGVTCNMDAGMFPMLHRKLNKKGIFTNEIRAWVEGGAGVENTGGGLGQTIPQRVTTSLTYAVPDIAVIACGYNDGTLNGNAGPSNLTTYETAWTDMVDELIAANADIQIVICNAVYNEHASFSPTEAAITNINGVINNVVSAYSNVKLADTFTGFGGFTAAADTYFQSDHIHPNTVGQAIYGRLAAEQINRI